VNLYKDFIKQKDASTNVRDRESTVAAFKTNQDSRSDNGNADMTVDDCYYTNKEYAKLSAAKKEGLRLKWLEQGHPSEEKPERAAKKQKTGNGKGHGHLSKRAIMAIAKQIQSLNLNQEEGSISDQSEAR